MKVNHRGVLNLCNHFGLQLNNPQDESRVMSRQLYSYFLFNFQIFSFELFIQMVLRDFHNIVYNYSFHSSQ